MPESPYDNLGRRERQIMDVSYEHGQVTVSDVVARMSDAPSYSAVRAMMRILEEKGQLVHAEDGKRYVYRPARPRGSAARSAIQQVVRTFFGGSASRAVATLLSDDETNLTEEELQRLSQLIEDARETDK